MKSLPILLILFFVTFGYAQDDKKETLIIVGAKETKIIISESVNAIVISARGIKKLEDLDIENYNKTLYLKLITSKKKKKPKRC